MIRFGWWLGNETVTRETWGVCPENLNSQKLPQKILPKSSTSKNCPKDPPQKIYLPKTADSDVSPIQMVRCWSLASWAPTCCRPSMDSYLSCQGAISPLNDIFASIIIININAIVVIIITMMFNSDGKIMYISETASVHLGLSQVLIRNINCDNVKFFQPSKIQSLSKSWVSRTPLWWYHNPITFKVELTGNMIYEYISTANNSLFSNNFNILIFLIKGWADGQLNLWVHSSSWSRGDWPPPYCSASPLFARYFQLLPTCQFLSTKMQQILTYFQLEIFPNTLLAVKTNYLKENKCTDIELERFFVLRMKCVLAKRNAGLTNGGYKVNLFQSPENNWNALVMVKSARLLLKYHFHPPSSNHKDTASYQQLFF